MTIEMREDQRRDYLKDEYLLLQNQYQGYDTSSLQIKGWVSAGAAAALALASKSDYDYGQSLFTVFIVTVIVLVMWVLEAWWKVFQFTSADRIRIIEAYFRNDPEILIKDPDPFQIYHWWFLSYVHDEPINARETREKRRPKAFYVRLLRAAWRGNVSLPYLPILVLCVISFIFLHFKV
jgi:hypothetical protein